MWNYQNPVNIVFGTNAFENIGTLLNGRGYALVTYDESIFQALSEKIQAAAGPARAVIGNVTQNPDFHMLGESCRMFGEAKNEIGVIVAIGGGSVIDAAKVLSASGGDFGVVKDFLETGDGGEQLTPLPIIAVPTTSGTGSEVTCWATVWDTDAQKKYSLNLPALYPEYAVVDPELMLGAPRGLTVSTGLDALSHALESIWNINANPVSSALAVSAAIDVLETLPALADDLDNLELRSRMARAAMISGLAFSNTKTALAHSVSYPITLKHSVPHGIACSFSLAMVMRWVVGNNDDCDTSLKRIFGPDLSAGADALQGFLEGLGIGTRPEDHGVQPDEWKSLVEEALAGERGRNFLGDRETVLGSL
ncbi:MAG: phosphonoacetaldehyde reductase [Alphaproteobacteria bacterium]|jgi:alcohol dehydrogenase|nr:phosphonoacetaldehyde reductase [Alphaproteobacteria bacterium]MBT7942600.1 phosphonoacetaldehyde reductase [Alphaproteobacteria bacterium]